MEDTCLRLLCACAELTCSFGWLTGDRPATVCFDHIGVQTRAVWPPLWSKYTVTDLFSASCLCILHAPAALLADVQPAN